MGVIQKITLLVWGKQKGIKEMDEYMKVGVILM